VDDAEDEGAEAVVDGSEGEEVGGAEEVEDGEEDLGGRQCCHELMLKMGGGHLVRDGVD